MAAMARFYSGVIVACTLFVVGCRTVPEKAASLSEDRPGSAEVLAVRGTFLRSIHGELPPVGQSIGMLVAVKLSRTGSYNTGAVDQIVGQLNQIVLGQKRTGRPLPYVIVSIDSSRVWAPASVISSKIAAEDGKRRQQSSAVLEIRSDEAKKVVFFTSDKDSYYAKKFGLNSDLSLVVIGSSGEKIRTCIVPGEADSCINTFKSQLDQASDES